MWLATVQESPPYHTSSLCGLSQSFLFRRHCPACFAHAKMSLSLGPLQTFQDHHTIDCLQKLAGWHPCEDFMEIQISGACVQYMSVCIEHSLVAIIICIFAARMAFQITSPWWFSIFLQEIPGERLDSKSLNNLPVLKSNALKPMGRLFFWATWSPAEIINVTFSHTCQFHSTLKSRHQSHNVSFILGTPTRDLEFIAHPLIPNNDGNTIGLLLHTAWYHAYSEKVPQTQQ